MKYIRIFAQGLLNILFALMLLVGLVLILLKCLGFKVLAIESGSMGADYPVGSAVILDSSSPENIQVGDVISFVANEDLVTVTHRVVKIDTEKRCFYTKGDANNIKDGSAVEYENLIGKVRLKIPLVGYTIIWAGTIGGKFVIASILSLIAISIGINYDGKRGSDNAEVGKEKT